MTHGEEVMLCKTKDLEVLKSGVYFLCLFYIVPEMDPYVQSDIHIKPYLVFMDATPSHHKNWKKMSLK